MNKTMELYKKILTDRMNYYQKKYEKDGRVQDFYSYKTYENALDMFEYAEKDDFDYLAQFDYLGEEED